MPIPKFTSLFAAAVFLGWSAMTFAQDPHPGAYTSSDRDIFEQHTGTWAAGGVSLGGTTFKVIGLQGVGRYSPSTVDSLGSGETIGSISDMEITNWSLTGPGTYSGTFNFLPDRGWNGDVSGTATYSNYAARINNFDFTFTPHAANTVTTPTQIAMSFTGSTRFTYDHDNDPLTAPVYTTGLLANGSTSLFGTQVPVATGNTTQSDGTIANRLTLDSEGLILDPRPGKEGSGWLGDEYGASIYHFNARKEIDGQLQLPAALLPHATAGGPLYFNDAPANLDGRRINQGMEGITLSPDGTKLYALLQSATMQDSTSSQQTRDNTRLVVYDVSGTDTPSDPVAQYVIQLPRVDNNGGTDAVNRTGAQSSIIALNDHQLLILSRDGNGRGTTGSAPVFKSILLADLNGATNLDGLFDGAGAAVAPGGALNASITPLTWTEALNMLGKLDLGVTELEQFGLNINAPAGDPFSISEKWEAMSLVPTLDGNPDEFFLFIGNDNDFQTATTKMLDANGVLQDRTNTLENFNTVLAYRVQVVPEPSTLVTLLGGVGLLALRRRRN